MYCRFCGAAIKPDARFCENCGNSLEEICSEEILPIDAVKKPSSKKWIFYLFGGILIVFGLLIYLLKPDFNQYWEYINRIYAQHSNYFTVISTVGIFNNFYSMLDPLFEFTSAFVVFYAGAILLKKRTNIAPLIWSIVIHSLSLIYSCATNIFACFFPETVISIFRSGKIDEMIDILHSEPDLLYYFRNLSIIRAVISLVVIAISIVVICLIRKKLKDPYVNKKDRTTVGIPIMLTVLPLMGILSNLMYTVISGRYGDIALAGVSLANQAFKATFVPVCLILLFACIMVSTVFQKAKEWILNLSTGVTLVIAGAVVYLFSAEILGAYTTYPEILSLASLTFGFDIIGGAAVVLCLFFWFSSVARETKPVWLQIFLPAILPVVYISTELFCSLWLNTLYIPYGAVHISILVTLMSFLVRRKKTVH